MIAELRRRRPGLDLSVSWTTRPPRPGETQDVHYRFTDSGGFQAAIKRGEFIEWEEYRGHLRGTPWTEVRKERPNDLVLELDVRGAKTIKTKFPDAITIFLSPPASEDLAERLRIRATDSPEEIAERLEAAQRELGAREEFDYEVKNDEVTSAVDRLEAIIDA